MLTYGSTSVNASVSAAQRRLAALAPELALVSDAAPIDLPVALEPARTVEAEIVESGAFEPRVVPGTPRPVFGAFLDGTQQTRVIAYSGTVPIVLGRTAAVVRTRVERRLVTWSAPLRDESLYLPVTLVSGALLARIGGSWNLVDTMPTDEQAEPAPAHPTAWAERAVHRVQRTRERLERQCAEAWCDARSDPLLLDGGLGSSDTLARSRTVVGVVKTHRTLYVSGRALGAVFALGEAERSPVFRIRPATRQPVLSWYLRLRDAGGRDPAFGLVRIEVSDDASGFTERADEISRWVLAERTPIGLPGQRWDRMVYGVYGAESYLKSL